MNEKMRIVGLGAGGHASVLIDIIRFYPERFEMVGFLDSDRTRHGSQWEGYDVLGNDNLLPELARLGVTGFFVGLGSVGNLSRRIELFNFGCHCRMKPIVLVHPQAILSPSAKVAEGACVLAGAVVNASATIGRNVCLNTCAIVEHDCKVGDHCFVSPRAVLAGGVRVDEQAFIGLGAVVLQGLHIGARALVAAGAVVVTDVSTETTVAGVPAKILSHHA